MGHQVDHGRLAVGVGDPPWSRCRSGCREAGSHQRLPGPGAAEAGALTTTGTLNASTCTKPSLAGFRVSSSVFPPARSLVVGTDFLPFSRMVVYSEAVASPTLAMVTAVVWPQQRADPAGRVGVAGDQGGRGLSPAGR